MWQWRWEDGAAGEIGVKKEESHRRRKHNTSPVETFQFAGRASLARRQRFPAEKDDRKIVVCDLARWRTVAVWPRGSVTLAGGSPIRAGPWQRRRHCLCQPA